MIFKTNIFLIFLFFCFACSTSNKVLKKEQLAQREQTSKQLTEIRVKLDNIRKELDDIKITLDKLSMQQEKYVSENPNTALTEFTPIIQQRKAEYSKLEEKLHELDKNYGVMLDKHNKGDLIDVDAFSAGVNELDNEVDNYRNKVLENYAQYKQTVSLKPDVSFQTDIFFGSGKYKIGNLQPSEKSKIDDYVSKIKKVRQESSFKDYKDNQLKLTIKVVGYTDGQGFQNDSGTLDIAQNCGIPSNSSDSALNLCLSKLRAGEIYRILSENFSAYKLNKDIVGKGDALANGSTTENSQIRKVEVSFSFIKIE